MHIDEIDICECELQQDEWSLTTPSFGVDGQIHVIGWITRDDDYQRKMYVVKCTTCSKDPELFQDGLFTTRKESLKSGWFPCGCSPRHRWTKNQYKVLCSRKAQELGYTFLGFAGEWVGNDTRISLSCSKHGIWDSCYIKHLRRGTGCPSCAAMNDDDSMINSFLSTGQFAPETIFTRSERVTKQGNRVYWRVQCPKCGEIGESTGHNLQKGSKPCACSRQRQKECYINIISNGVIDTAIKFGIARDSKQRSKAQNSKSVYDIRQHSTYAFTTTNLCKKAERECKKELECGIVLKRDMPDGFTETTWLYNLEKIVEIYERNGGVLNV